MKTGHHNKFLGAWLLTALLGTAGAQVCRAQEGGEKQEPPKKEEKTLDVTTPTLDVTTPVTDTSKGGTDVKTPVLDVKKPMPPPTKTEDKPTKSTVGRARPRTRIACVGDSITAGIGTNRPDKEGYPAVLERLLGDDYAVRNFGVSGAGVLRDGESPYVYKPKSKPGEVVKNPFEEYGPDVVIIMLGTNDSKPKNWAHKDDFASDLNKLLDFYSGLPSKPKVYVALPPPTYSKNFNIDGSIIQDNIIPAIRQAVSGRGIALIDTNTPMAHNGQYFPDGVHPNKAGAEALANIVQKAVSAPYIKP